MSEKDQRPEWEGVESFEGKAWSTVTERIPVPGGWLYRTTVVIRTGGVSTSAVFVPCVRHTQNEYDPASIRGGLGT